MNLRKFRSSRRMTRRSSTCRSALLMVLPKRRNNLYISILPGVFSVASVRQRLWMHCSWQERAQAPQQERAPQEWAWAPWQERRLRRLSRSGRLRSLGRSGAGSVVASMPSFLIRLRRWLRVPPGADPWPPSPSQRWCLSAVRQPRSRRRAGARAQSKRPQGQTSSAHRVAGGKRNCTHAKSTLVSTLDVAKC